MTAESLSDGDYLVQVQAQVMIRDESSGGWLPMERGGLSKVGLKHLKVNSGSETRNEYSIIGKRITDNSVVLNCSLKSDIEYFRINPKFLHWKTSDQKFGLTFESSYDAKAFDKYMSKAVLDLSYGYLNGCPTTNIDVDDAVFQMIDLPRGRTGSSSQSASTTSTTTSSPTPQSPTSVIPGLHDSFSFSSHPHRVTYINSSHHRPSPHALNTGSGKSDSFDSSSGGGGGLDDPWVRGDEPTSLSGKSEQGLLDVEVSQDDSYVYFAKNKPGAPHEYSYPSLEPTQKPPTKRETSSKRQTFVSAHPPSVSLPLKMNKNQSRTLLGAQSRCKHCNEIFSLEDNARGSCEDAPDRVTKFIECVTCVICAHSVNYHCLSDADGEYRHPCTCEPKDATNCKRWTVMTVLSFFLPCLWCYPPLTACFRCGVSCGCCGARHKAT